MSTYRGCVFLALVWYTAATAQWQSVGGGVNNEVRAFAVSTDGSKLLVSGKFPYVHQDDLRVNNLAWWNGEQWSNDGLAGGNGSPLPQGDTSPVFSLCIREDTLFVSFLADRWHEDPSIRHAAMLTDGAWSSCGNPENWFFLLEANGRLFGGGRSDTLYGNYMPMVNEWRAGAWQPVEGSPFGSTGTIYDMAFWHGDYYFVGSFLAGDARSAIRFDGTDQWTALGEGVGGNFIEAVCGYGDSLFVGGSLPPGPNVESQHIQIWDGMQWLPFFNEVFASGKVNAIQQFDGALYIAGGFKFGSDTTQYGLIRFDGQQICALGGSMVHGGGRMAFFQDDLYMALPPMNEQLSYEHIGRLDLDTVLPDTCVSITSNGQHELFDDQTLRVYPSLVGHQLNVVLADLAGRTDLVVYNGLGQPVLAQTTQATRTELDVTQLPEGLYTLVASNREWRQAVKFLVQRW